MAMLNDDNFDSGLAELLMGQSPQIPKDSLADLLAQRLQGRPISAGLTPVQASPGTGSYPFMQALKALTQAEPAVRSQFPDGRFMPYAETAGKALPVARTAPATTTTTVTPSASAAAATPAAANSKLDLDKAVDYLDKNALPAYDKEKAGNCAKAVRLAIGAGGRDVPNARYAKDYGPNLVQAGYTRLEANAREAYTPQRGDVIIYPAAAKHPHGHMEMYDGKQWVSDFKQKGPVPFGDGTLPYEIYRP